MGERRINARAIVWRDGKLLAVKHKSVEDGSESPYWAVPGGGLDFGESLQDGVKREVFEELGVHAAVGKLLFVQQLPSTREGYTEELEFFFQVEDSPQFDTIDLTATSHGAIELATVAFVDPKAVDILPRLLGEQDIAAQIAADPPVYIFSRL